MFCAPTLIYIVVEEGDEPGSCFNSTKVRLKVSRLFYPCIFQTGFNSTKVRLKDKTESAFFTYIKMFQFH